MRKWEGLGADELDSSVLKKGSAIRQDVDGVRWRITLTADTDFFLQSAPDREPSTDRDGGAQSGRAERAWPERCPE